MKTLTMTSLGFETIHGIKDEIVDLAGKGILEPARAQGILQAIRVKGFELSQVLRDEVALEDPEDKEKE